jgi:hypothetical protein
MFVSNPIPCNPWLYLDPCNPCYSYQDNPTDGAVFDAPPIYSDVSSNVRHSVRLLLSVALVRLATTPPAECHSGGPFRISSCLRSLRSFAYFAFFLLFAERRWLRLASYQANKNNAKNRKGRKWAIVRQRPDHEGMGPRSIRRRDIITVVATTISAHKTARPCRT